MQLIIYHYITWEELTEKKERTTKLAVSTDKVTFILLPRRGMFKFLGSYKWLYLKTIKMVC